MIAELLFPEVQAYINTHLYDDPTKLLLQGSAWEKDFHRAVVEQIVAKRKAEKKLPKWFDTPNIIYPTPLAMEQCSSEITAQYKAQMIQGETLIDLTGGFGVDTYFLAQNFKKAFHIEQDRHLSLVAQHNFKSLAAHITCIHTTAENHLEIMPRVDWIYLDPARRSESQQRVVALDQYSPNVLLIKDLLLKKAKNIMLKVSPMMDLKQLIAQLPELYEIWVLTVKNEVKEVVALLATTPVAKPLISCVHLGEEQAKPFAFTFTEEQTAEVVYGALQKYLYEPHAGLMKAGAFKTLAARLGLTKLHQHTHLYTSEDFLPDFPGRIFEVEKVLPVRKKVLQQSLQELKAHLTIRNFPMSVADLRKKLNLKTGGDTYAFATTDTLGKHLVLTRKAAKTAK